MLADVSGVGPAFGPHQDSMSTDPQIRSLLLIEEYQEHIPGSRLRFFRDAPSREKLTEMRMDLQAK